MTAKVQRLRATYERGGEVRYVSHLDMMRFWERALRRAHLPLAYSEGFSPHPQIAMGAPLPVGMTSQDDLLDVFLAEAMPPEAFRTGLQGQMPAGIRIYTVVEVPLNEPSLQSQLRAAEYELAFQESTDLDAAERQIGAFLETSTFPWEQVRGKETRRYDLRPLVLALDLQRRPAGAVLVARLRAEEQGTGRPEQLATALGLLENVTSIARTALFLADAAAPSSTVI